LYHDSDLWHSLRENALNRIEQEYSKEVFLEKIRHILNIE
jgi:hypothetical protein